MREINSEELENDFVRTYLDVTDNKATLVNFNILYELCTEDEDYACGAKFSVTEIVKKNKVYEVKHTIFYITI